MKNINTHLLGLVIVAIIWGSGFVATDILLLSLSPISLLATRFVIASIILLIFNFKKLVRIDKSSILSGTLLGIILFLSFAFQTYGLKYSSPSHNAFLTSVNVIIVPFIVWGVTKIRVDLSGFLGAFLSIIGIGILSLTSNFTLSKGDSLNLICAFGFAFHVFFSGKFAKKYDIELFVTIQMIVASVLSILLVALSNDTTIFNIGLHNIVEILYLGIIVTALAFFMQSTCQKTLEDTTSAIIMSMEAVFGTIFSVLLLGENITPRLIIGCTLILSGVLVSQTSLFSRTNTKVRNQIEA